MTTDELTKVAPMTNSMTDLIRWLEDHPYADARLRSQTGCLITQTTTYPDDTSRTIVRLRDVSRRGHKQYLLIHDRDIERGLEIKVGARYQPARDVLV